MKWFLFAIGAAAGAAIFLIVHNYYEFVEQTKAFESKGARFTADDGQALCLRILALEVEQKPCEYSQK